MLTEMLYVHDASTLLVLWHETAVHDPDFIWLQRMFPFSLRFMLDLSNMRTHVVYINYVTFSTDCYWKTGSNAGHIIQVYWPLHSENS
jgi:hypothetical protein